MATRTREEPRSVGGNGSNPKCVGLCCTADVAAGISCPDTKKNVEEWLQAAQEGKGAAKAPSIKEMKATIRKAGFGVADLVEKSDVVKRYQEALARLGTA